MAKYDRGLKRDRTVLTATEAAEAEVRLERWVYAREIRRHCPDNVTNLKQVLDRLVESGELEINRGPGPGWPRYRRAVSLAAKGVEVLRRLLADPEFVGGLSAGDRAALGGLVGLRGQELNEVVFGEGGEP